MKEHLERIRRFIATFPETHEKLSHGAPTWWWGSRAYRLVAPKRAIAALDRE